MSKTVLAWLAILCVVSGGTSLALAIKYFHEMQVSSGGGGEEVDLTYRNIPESGKADWLTEFTLTERSGKQLGTADLKGKVHVINFFFSSCPQSCLQQNKTLEGIQRQYGPKGVQFVGITCDPRTDTPQTLRAYADRNFPGAGASWWFLTGDLTYVQRIAGEIYRVPLDEKTHSERFIVMDKWGNQRGQFHWSKPEELTDMRRLLSKLLVESQPPSELVKEAASPASDANAAAPSDGNDSKVPASGAPPAKD